MGAINNKNKQLLIKMELRKGKVFYEIFKSTDKNWTTNITPIKIKSILGEDYQLDFIESVIMELIDEGVLSKEKDLFKVNYTNTRLY